MHECFENERAVEIEATPEQQSGPSLLDFPAYPDWNPFIRLIKGTPDRGGAAHSSPFTRREVRP